MEQWDRRWLRPPRKEGSPPGEQRREVGLAQGKKLPGLQPLGGLEVAGRRSTSCGGGPQDQSPGPRRHGGTPLPPERRHSASFCRLLQLLPPSISSLVLALLLQTRQSYPIRYRSRFAAGTSVTPDYCLGFTEQDMGDKDVVPTLAEVATVELRQRRVGDLFAIGKGGVGLLPLV